METKRFNVINADSKDTYLSMNFMYKPTSTKPYRIFSLQRLKSDTLETTLYRISQNISKVIKKGQRQKKKGQSTESETQESSGTMNLPSSSSLPCLEVKLMLNDLSEVDKGIPNIDAWKDGCILFIEDRKFDVVLNPPLVSNLKLPLTIMAGFPVYPLCELAFADTTRSEWFWFVQVTKEEAKMAKHNDQTLCTATKKDFRILDLCMSLGLLKQSSWVGIGSGWSFVPGNDTVNHKLAVVCVPKNGDKSGMPAVVSFKLFLKI